MGLAVLAAGVLAAAFHVAYNAYVRGALEVAEAMRIMVEANPAHRIDVAGPAELRLIAQSANALSEHSQALTRDLETKVQQAKSSVEEEKNRLAALMSELSQGVLVCNIDGRILLYNESARQALGAGGNGQATGPAPTSLIGLGRSIFAVVDRSLLAHALETVESRLERREPYLNAQFVTTTRAGQLIRVQMAPVLAASGAARDAGPGGTAVAYRERPNITGFVMMLENITRSFERDTTRDLLLQAFTEASRASLASIRAAVETLTEYPDCAPHERDRFIRVIREEVGNLGAKLEQTTADYASALKTRWPLEEILGTDVIEALRRQIENRLGIATKVA